MPIGVARAGFGGKRTTFLLTISASVNDKNLRTVANAAGYINQTDITITINSNITIGSTTTATAALVPGTWPSGVTVTLVNNGYIRGKGGAGGPGANFDGTNHGGTAGSSGGTALNASGISGFTFAVDNTSGTIAGGGGGGGGGYSWASNGCCCIPYGAAGAGGGGGQGDGGGAGGAAGTGNTGWGVPTNGTAGTNASVGSGNITPNSSYRSGDGGAYGATGGTGSGSAAGGAGGNSVSGTANITWIAFGIRTGTVA